MEALLNFISVTAAFVFGVGSIYWIMDITIGKLKFLNSENEWYGLQIKDLIFLVISFFLVLNFISFYRPY